jgi:hypothetical protein
MDSSKAKRREDVHALRDAAHGTGQKKKKRIFAEMAAIR